MQRDPAKRGLDAENPRATVRWSYSFWSEEYAGSDVGCPGLETYYQPYFSGFGGIRMVLMPNGAVYYYFMDFGEFEMANEIREAGKISPGLCQ